MSESIVQRINKVAADQPGFIALFNAVLADLTAIRAVLAGILSGSATYDAPSIAAGSTTTTTVTVTGAALGDFAMASLSVSAAGLGVSAYVSASNTVTVVLNNNTAGAIDLASATVRARVLPQASFAAAAALSLAA